MKQTNLPISLLNEKAKNARVHILDSEPFDSVFGKRKTRKKPNLKVSIYEFHNKNFAFCFFLYFLWIIHLHLCCCHF